MPHKISFNNIVWMFCSKTKFVGHHTIAFACHLAILVFNEGKESAVNRLSPGLITRRRRRDARFISPDPHVIDMTEQNCGL